MDLLFLLLHIKSLVERIILPLQIKKMSFILDLLSAFETIYFVHLHH